MVETGSHDREPRLGVGGGTDPSNEGDAGDRCGRGEHDGVADGLDQPFAWFEGVEGELCEAGGEVSSGEVPVDVG